MVILGLDLGLNCGWCLMEDGEIFESGAWDLKERRFSGGGMCYLKFRVNLFELNAQKRPDHIAYEEVRAHAGTDAAHMYGGFQSILTSVAEHLSIPYDAYPVGAIKKYATGKGNASKESMKVAFVVRFPDHDHNIISEDEVDAVWIAAYAGHTLKAGE